MLRKVVFFCRPFCCARNPPERSSCEIRDRQRMWRNFGEIFRRFSSFDFQAKWSSRISRKILDIFHIAPKKFFFFFHCCNSRGWGAQHFARKKAQKRTEKDKNTPKCTKTRHSAQTHATPPFIVPPLACTQWASLAAKLSREEITPQGDRCDNSSAEQRAEHFCLQFSFLAYCATVHWGAY